MTAFSDSNSNLKIRMDGVTLANASKQVTTTPSGKERFWASTPRLNTNLQREILEISLGAPRLLNHVSFDISHFPLTAFVQYLDSKGAWRYLTHQNIPTKMKTREPIQTPIAVRINDSVPHRVDSAKATTHPQHWGKNHWVPESWSVTPVTTSKIRFVLVRKGISKPPVNPAGKHVPYSLALRNIKFGYRVTTKADLPKPPPPPAPGEPPPWWASSRDILGSRTVYSTYQQDAHSAVDGNSATFWRSEPQPFPFAVVNLFLDLRDQSGEAPVVDRFWIDPVTVGPVCNLYYANEEPDGDFDGDSQPIPDQFLTKVGNPIIPVSGADNVPLSIDLDPAAASGVSVSNVYQRMNYSQPWWVGIDARSLVNANDAQIRPIVSLGSTQIFQSNGSLTVTDADGRAASIVLDPALHGVNTSFRLMVAYYPPDAASGRDAYFRIVYRLANWTESTFSEAAVPDLIDSNDPMKIGLAADPASTKISAIAIKGLVIKSESLTPDTEDWFLDEGALYVADPDTPQTDRGTAQNARLRMHPDFLAVPSNPFGVVNGASSRFDDMVWTPINRDYTLRRGYMHLPPTKARFWKFEMTRLLPQVYENFVTINREVLVFPPDVVDNHSALTAGTTDLPPSGVNTLGNISEQLTYNDVLNAAAKPLPPAGVTDVLVVKDIRLASRAAQSGWIWTYQPWHVGSRAPQFMGSQQHHYESIMVDHTAKVAYFAGIKEIEPFRVDYTFDDDTPEYVEHLLDDKFLDTTALSGMVHEEGSLTALSARAEATSKPFRSYRTVRGVQFATQETDSFQVLANPDFADASGWFAYGDSDLTLIGPSDLRIDRGWFSYTWGDAETSHANYGAMDGVLYGALEGNDPDTGYAEGGMVSRTYSPSGAGKVTARAKISTEENMTSPVRLEIIAVATGQVVALAEAFPKRGETTILECGYAPGALLDWHTYGDTETTYPTYGDMEGVLYSVLETEQLQTDLFVRIRQTGATRDSFHVHRLGFYDSPIAWYFSNDEGASWWQAIDVANNPHGVLIFPPTNDPSPGPEVGRSLMWRARFFTAGANLSALHIRPWYGNRSRTVTGAHTMKALGPNHSIYDDFPSTARHPMWALRSASEESAIAVITSPTSDSDNPAYGGGTFGGGTYGS